METIFDEEPSRSIPTRGRRAFKESTDKAPQDAGNTSSPSDAISPVVSQIKLGGAEDPQLSKSDKPGRRRQMWNIGEDMEDERLKVDEENDSDGPEDIPTIPDLEELYDEPITDQVAAPPSMIFNELLSYQELDMGLMRQSAFQMLDNEIDMKILTKALVPERDIVENDETWEMDKLFAEMQSIVTCCNKNIIGQEEAVKSTREVLI